MKQILSIFIMVSFVVTGVIGPVPSYAQDYHLPAPGVMVRLSPPFDPPILKGIKVHPDNPFRFDFILDQGDSPSLVQRGGRGELKQEATKLIKYFLASLTIPEKDLWVNLSPYEKDRIIPNSFGLTEMGRDLLAEDYMLKQITASLIYPEDEVGKRFWKRIYEEAAKRFGTTNIPVNTFNKVWIVPKKAVVYENAKAGTAYVVESKLKVMLEQDYLSLQKHEGTQSYRRDAINGISTNQLGAQIVREIVIPQLTKEVNENKNFARLRQVYNSLILAAWYKKKIKDSILSYVYADRNKVAGIGYNPLALGRHSEGDQRPTEESKTDFSPSAQNDIELIYQRYLQAFKKGVFNYIKEESLPSLDGNEKLFPPLDGEGKGGVLIPRKYFSGGADMTHLGAASILSIGANKAMLSKIARGLKQIILNVVLNTVTSSNIKTRPDGRISISGFPLLPKQYVKDMERILSLCRPEDLKGLNITVMPFWHPMSVLPLLKGTRGFQYSKGIVAIASLKRQAFIELFTHELTHWLLRNKPTLRNSLADKIFDARDRVLEGVHLPSYYASVNRTEYAAELAVFALTHRENGKVITARQREIIAREIFNTTEGKFYFPATNEIGISPVSPLLLSAMGHAWVISLVSQNQYFKYVGSYTIFVLISALAVSLVAKYYKDGLVTKKVKRTIDASIDNVPGRPSGRTDITFAGVNTIQQKIKNSRRFTLFLAIIGLLALFNYVSTPMPHIQPDIQPDIQKEEKHQQPEPKPITVELQYPESHPDGGKPKHVNKKMSAEEVARLIISSQSGSAIYELWTTGGVIGRFRLHPITYNPTEIINALKRGNIVIVGEYYVESDHWWPLYYYMNTKKGVARWDELASLMHYDYPLKTRSQLLHTIKDELKYVVNIHCAELIPESENEGMHDDKAMIDEKGGIDLTPSHMNLQTQNAGEGIKLHLDPAMLAQLRNAPGFVPVIINTQPMTSLEQFLGLATHG